MKDEHRFMADGRKRAIQGNLPEVVKKIQEKYAAEMKKAGFFGKIVLRRRMKREIKAEMERIAPKGACY
ncbi:MAG: hypothetical protein ACYTHM_20780 [Planctomycetota bacterium]|jgi:hypothetical protein